MHPDSGCLPFCLNLRRISSAIAFFDFIMNRQNIFSVCINILDSCLDLSGGNLKNVGDLVWQPAAFQIHEYIVHRAASATNSAVL